MSLQTSFNLNLDPRSGSRAFEDLQQARVERQFLKELDTLLLAQVDLGQQQFDELAKSCLGAWPGLISERLSALGLSVKCWSGGDRSREAAEYSPELHLNSCEWYFSKSTAKALSGEFLDGGGLTLFCGTPTLAHIATDRQLPFLLVDKNPLLAKRFPRLGNQLLQCDVLDIPSEISGPRTIFLDPPWYLPAFVSWLTKLARISLRSTRIVMPVLRPLTRPSAARDRQILFEFAETIGFATIIENCVEYDTPLFECEALMARGICPPLTWRRADLLIIENIRRDRVPSDTKLLPKEEWETFVIGTQTIQLRIHPRSRRQGFLLKPLPGADLFEFDSVSARDKRRPHIDLLSSRNRAASVGDLPRLRYVLSKLSQSDFAHERRIPKDIARQIPQHEVKLLEEFLCWKASN